MKESCRVVETCSRGRCVSTRRALGVGTLLLRESPIEGIDLDSLGPTRSTAGKCFRPLSKAEEMFLRQCSLFSSNRNNNVKSRKNVNCTSDHDHNVCNEEELRSSSGKKTRAHGSHGHHSRSDSREYDLPFALGVLAYRIATRSQNDSKIPMTINRLCRKPGPSSAPLTDLASILSIFLKASFGDGMGSYQTAGACLELLEKLSCNVFTVFDEVLQPVAIALYAVASSFNHSCKPNASHIFVFEDKCPPVVQIRSSSPMFAGEEVCIAYIDVGPPRSERMVKLFENYGFTCSCERCSVLDPQDAWPCHHPSCTGQLQLSPSYWHFHYLRCNYRSTPLCTSERRVKEAAMTVYVRHSSSRQSIANDCSRVFDSEKLLSFDPFAASFHSSNKSYLQLPDASSLYWLYASQENSSWCHLSEEMELEGIHFVCTSCGSKRRVEEVKKDSCRCISMAGDLRTLSISASGSKNGLITKFRRLRKLLPCTHYTVFDIGSRLCVRLLCSKRYEEALCINLEIIPSLLHSYSRYCLMHLIQYYQVSKLLYLMNMSQEAVQFHEEAIRVAGVIYSESEEGLSYCHSMRSAIYHTLL